MSFTARLIQTRTITKLTVLDQGSAQSGSNCPGKILGRYTFGKEAFKAEI
jgi:hypothetical protein